MIRLSNFVSNFDACNVVLSIPPSSVNSPLLRRLHLIDAYLGHRHHALTERQLAAADLLDDRVRLDGRDEHGVTDPRCPALLRLGRVVGAWARCRDICSATFLPSALFRYTRLDLSQLSPRIGHRCRHQPGILAPPHRLFFLERPPAMFENETSKR